MRGSLSECASLRLSVWRQVFGRLYGRLEATCRPALCGMWGKQSPAWPAQGHRQRRFLVALSSLHSSPLRLVIPAKSSETHTSRTLIAQGLAVSIRLFHRRRRAQSPNLKRTSACVSGKHVLCVSNQSALLASHITRTLCIRVSQAGFDARSSAISSGQHATMDFPGRPLQPAGGLVAVRRRQLVPTSYVLRWKVTINQLPIRG